MECFFELPFRIDSHDCGMDDLLKPSGCLRYLQETANIQCARAGFGYDDCLARGSAFVLSRVSLDILEPVHAYDEVIVRTCPAESRGVSFNRGTSMYKNGREVLRLNSVWALLRLRDRALVRVEDAGLTLPVMPLHETAAPLKFHIPRDAELRQIGSFTVRPSVCDRNRHMNNTRYADLFSDLLPPDSRLTGLSISYRSEAPLGETLTLFSGDAPDGVYLFRALKSDGSVCCEAKITINA